VVMPQVWLPPALTEANLRGVPDGDAVGEMPGVVAVTNTWGGAEPSPVTVNV